MPTDDLGAATQEAVGPRPCDRAVVLGTRVDRTTYGEVGQIVIEQTAKRAPGYVCVANVHMVMEAYDNPSFQRIVNSATIVTPDGMPLVWCLRLLTGTKAERVYGPALFLSLCELASVEGIRIGLFGSTPQVIELLTNELLRKYPKINIAYAFSPPIGEFSPGQDEGITQEIRASGASIIFVGLGCPKQEQWMASHVSKIEAVMVGVGAAFDFVAGTKPQAPEWMQRIGMEWSFRLATEPRRLWKRYFYHNPRFLALAGRQIVKTALSRQ